MRWSNSTTTRSRRQPTRTQIRASPGGEPLSPESANALNSSVGPAEIERGLGGVPFDIRVHQVLTGDLGEHPFGIELGLTGAEVLDDLPYRSSSPATSPTPKARRLRGLCLLLELFGQR